MNRYGYAFSCLLFLFCFGEEACGLNNEKSLPRFTRQPPSAVYYTESPQLGHRLVPSFDVIIAVQPSNVSLSVAAAYSDNPENYVHLPLLRRVYDAQILSEQKSFSQPYATSSAVLDHYHNQGHGRSSTLKNPLSFGTDATSWSVSVHNLPQNMFVYIMASNELGTVRSLPIKPIRIELTAFPRYADENLSLLIGNTGRIICHLPRAQPSLPTVNFYHDGNRLDLANGNRFRLLYIGGDGTGLPWEQHAPTRPTDPSPQIVFTRSMPSAAVLLIHPLQLTDSGEYRCQAKLFDREVFSDQRTLLNVTKPQEKIPATLRFSSDDPELSYLYSHLITVNTDRKEGQPQVSRTFTVPEGMNLTLFCIYHGAPVVSTRWYFDGQSQHVVRDRNFGVLSIGSVTEEDESTYTCSAQAEGGESISKSFRIHVRKKPVLIPTPSNSIRLNEGEVVTLGCYPDYVQTQAASPETNAFFEEYRKFALDMVDRTEKGEGAGDGMSAYSNLTNQFSGSHKSTTEVTFGWLHNGKSVESRTSSPKFRIKGTLLRINNFTNYDKGIYQCWSAHPIEGWSSASISITLNQRDWVHEEAVTEHPEHQVIQERTQEGLTGHLNCNVSSLLPNSTSNQTLIAWFRGKFLNEPIDLLMSNRRAGGIKYLTSQVSRGSQLLSIVNPRIGRDDGFYACRVYDSNTRKLQGQLRFELVIDPNTEEFVNQRKEPSSNGGLQPPLKSGEESSSQNQFPTLPKADQNFVAKRGEDDFKIEKPKVGILANFLLAVYISWQLTDAAVSENVSHFQIEYRTQLPPETSLHKRRQMTKRSSHKSTSADLDRWTAALTLKSVSNRTSLCIYDDGVFFPGNVYSLRVLGLPSADNMRTMTSDRIWRSPWSNPVSFRHILPFSIELLTVTARNSTSLYAEWIFPGKSNQTFRQRDVLSLHNVYTLQFTIVYRELSNSTSGDRSLLEDWMNCTSSWSQETQDLVCVRPQETFAGLWEITLNDGQRNYHRALENLTPNKSYVIALYGQILRTGQVGKDDEDVNDWYTVLSNELIQQTLPENVHWTVGKSATSEMEEVDKRTPSLNDTNRGVKTSAENTSSVGHTAEKRNENSDGPKSGKRNPHGHEESYLLIVVLGSLAGVLLVISLALISLCVWYHVRGRRHAYTAAFESPNKPHPTTSFVELSTGPSAHLLNMGNPVLNFIDPYQAGYSTEPNSHHIGIINPVLTQPYTSSTMGPWATIPSGCGNIRFDPYPVQPQFAGLAWSSSINSPMNTGQINSAYQTNLVELPNTTHISTYPTSVGDGVRTDLMTSSQAQSPEDGVQFPKAQTVNKLNACDGLNRMLPNDTCRSLGLADQSGIEDESHLNNDNQSSSIYSHIGSQSTLDEMPLRGFEKLTCLSPPALSVTSVPNGRRSSYSSTSSQKPTELVDAVIDDKHIKRPIPMYLSAPNEVPAYLSHQMNPVYGYSYYQPRPASAWMDADTAGNPFLTNGLAGPIPQPYPSYHQPYLFSVGNSAIGSFPFTQPAAYYRTLPTPKLRSDMSEQRFGSEEPPPFYTNPCESANSPSFIATTTNPVHWPLREQLIKLNGMEAAKLPHTNHFTMDGKNPILGTDSNFVLKKWIESLGQSSNSTDKQGISLHQVPDSGQYQPQRVSSYPNSEEQRKTMHSAPNSDEQTGSKSKKLNSSFADSGVDLQTPANVDPEMETTRHSSSRDEQTNSGSSRRSEENSGSGKRNSRITSKSSQSENPSEQSSPREQQKKRKGTGGSGGGGGEGAATEGKFVNLKHKRSGSSHDQSDEPIGRKSRGTKSHKSQSNSKKSGSSKTKDTRSSPKITLKNGGNDRRVSRSEAMRNTDQVPTTSTPV
ncbi:unnamed protein product [Calicophoron daubneyi]|uniref:Ig-like domain-containing protein n=1 Tax=Calicophoron daubneyi TaxID=300641 RepID=A0AAV2TX81_CALDB